MARNLSMVLFAAVAAVALLQSSASAATYFVGDSSNWAIPSSSNAYANWAANKNFVVGDILVFNFMQNQHDVAEVTKSAYDACNGANPISRQTSSPANVTLRSAGAHYYICTVSGHCSAGQKLAISVTRSGAPAPSPQPGDTSPSPSPSPALAPQPSSPSPSPSPAALAPQPSSPSPSPSPALAPQISSPSPAPTPALAPSSPSPSADTPTTSTSATPPSSATPPPTPAASDSPTTTEALPPNGAASLGATTFLSFAALALWL